VEFAALRLWTVGLVARGRVLIIKGGSEDSHLLARRYPAAPRDLGHGPFPDAPLLKERARVGTGGGDFDPLSLQGSQQLDARRVGVAQLREIQTYGSGGCFSRDRRANFLYPCGEEAALEMNCGDSIRFRLNDAQQPTVS